MNNIQIRKALPDDRGEILSIYERARKYMAENGNPSQWGSNYPSSEDVDKDMKRDALYVCESEDGIEAVFMFDIGEEPNYKVIYEGQWKNGESYGFLHRVASAGRKKGMASACMSWCFQRCHNLRGDTHEDNIPMQRVFEKNGFERCGIVHMEDGTPRIAYQKSVKNVLFYGDSNTHGYDGATGGRFPWGVRFTSLVQDALGKEGIRVIEEGLNGRTTVWDDPVEENKNGLKYLLPCLESQSPLDVVVLMLGTNDMKVRFSLCAADVAAGAETLVKNIKRYFMGNGEPVPKILLISPIELRSEIVSGHFGPMFGGVRGVEMSRQLASLYEEAAARQGCWFLNGADITLPGTEDFLHLDREGHRKFAEAVTAKLHEMFMERK